MSTYLPGSYSHVRLFLALEVHALAPSSHLNSQRNLCRLSIFIGRPNDQAVSRVFAVHLLTGQVSPRVLDGPQVTAPTHIKYTYPYQSGSTSLHNARTACVRFPLLLLTPHRVCPDDETIRTASVYGENCINFWDKSARQIRPACADDMHIWWRQRNVFEVNFLDNITSKKNWRKEGTQKISESRL